MLYIRAHIEGIALRFRAKSLKIQLFIRKRNAYPYCTLDTLFVMVGENRCEAQI
jgi:hypothetical protein